MGHCGGFMLKPHVAAAGVLVVSASAPYMKRVRGENRARLEY
jgi:hypothetical protein